MSAALEELITVTRKKSLQGHNKVSAFINNATRRCPYFDEEKKDNPL